MKFAFSFPLCSLSTADLKLVVFDIARFPAEPLCAATAALVDADSIVIFNKSDAATLAQATSVAAAAASGGGISAIDNGGTREHLQTSLLRALPQAPAAAVLLSCRYESGFDEVLDALGTFAQQRYAIGLQRPPASLPFPVISFYFLLVVVLILIHEIISHLSYLLCLSPSPPARAHSLAGGGGTEDPLITRERHRAHLQQCVDRLRACAAHLRDRDAATLVLAAEELRQAIRALGCVTGRVEVEDLLDVIFRDFCIGK